MIKVIVDSMLRAQASDLRPGELERIFTASKFLNPEYARLIAFGGGVVRVAEYIYSASFDGDMVVMPRGFHRKLTAIVGKVEWDDKRSLCCVDGCEPSVTLRDYQRVAAGKFYSARQGYVCAPCGAGKSVIGLACICAAAQKTLLLVHTRDLVGQWDALINSMAPAMRKHITIATIQSLRDKPLPEHGMLLLDEAHHVPASTFAGVVSRSSAVFRLGLTATPYRHDGLGEMIDDTFGARLADISHDQLIGDGHLVKASVLAAHTGRDYVVNDYADMIAQMIHDDDRNATVLSLAVMMIITRGQCMILSRRVDHCRKLADSLSALGFAASPLTGSMSAKDRKRALADLRSGKLQAVVATTVADEGLDVPSLSAMILATPSRAKGATIQRIGRLMRPEEGKMDPVLIDLVDDCPLARSQWRARKHAYKSVLGINPTEVRRD